VKGWVRLREQLRFAHAAIFDVGGIVDKEVSIVDTCVYKGSSYCLSHVLLRERVEAPVCRL